MKHKAKKNTRHRTGGGKQTDQNATNANPTRARTARRTTQALKTKVTKNAKAS
jgi:hypothetical protein